MPYPAKPTPLHKRDGTYRKHRHDKRLEVAPADRIPDPPPNFDERHTDKWYEVCNRLKEMGILSTNDVDAIQQYCRAWFDLEDAEATLEKEGKYLYADNGSARVHPAWRVKTDAQKALRTLSAAFGFSPADRTKVGAYVKQPTAGVNILELMAAGKRKV